MFIIDSLKVINQNLTEIYNTYYKNYSSVVSDILTKIRSCQLTDVDYEIANELVNDLEIGSGYSLSFKDKSEIRQWSGLNHIDQTNSLELVVALRQASNYIFEDPLTYLHRITYTKRKPKIIRKPCQLKQELVIHKLSGDASSKYRLQIFVIGIYSKKYNYQSKICSVFFDTTSQIKDYLQKYYGIIREPIELYYTYPKTDTTRKVA